MSTHPFFFTCGIYKSIEIKRFTFTGYLGNIVGLVLDHHNEASITIKRVVVVLLLEDLPLQS